MSLGVAATRPTRTFHSPRSGANSRSGGCATTAPSHGNGCLLACRAVDAATSVRRMHSTGKLLALVVGGVTLGAWFLEFAAGGESRARRRRRECIGPGRRNGGSSGGSSSGGSSSSSGSSSGGSSSSSGSSSGGSSSGSGSSSGGSSSSSGSSSGGSRRAAAFVERLERPRDSAGGSRRRRPRIHRAGHRRRSDLRDADRHGSTSARHGGNGLLRLHGGFPLYSPSSSAEALARRARHSTKTARAGRARSTDTVGLGNGSRRSPWTSPNHDGDGQFFAGQNDYQGILGLGPTGNAVRGPPGTCRG